MKKLVFGIGINDADYAVQKYEALGYTAEGKRLQKLIWMCPFYARWFNMMRRCYSTKFHKDRPTYIECLAVPQWHYFMTFRAWMEKQDWENKELDKDILFPGNHIYGPDTCVFVDQAVNSFIIERQNNAGEWPIGVTFDKKFGRYIARCSNPMSGKRENLGRYDNATEAHQAWLCCKLEHAKLLASIQEDPRVAKALIDRYENYKS